jgi:REP element-mobilizing transposase RayT
MTAETAILWSVDHRNRPPQRKNIRLPAEAYRTGDPFHVDVCTADRRPVFRDSRLAGMVARRLNAQLRESGGPVLAYCLMHEHLHLEIVADPDLVLWVRLFKSATAAQAARLGLQGRLWQRGFHDRCLTRTDETLADVARYIVKNPVRAGLVQRAEDWPCSRISSLL